MPYGSWGKGFCWGMGSVGAWVLHHEMIWGEMQRCSFLFMLLGLAADAGGHSTGLCIECEAGSYFSGDNSECLPCLENSMSPAGSSALNDCRCNAGFEGPNGDLPCTQCTNTLRLLELAHVLTAELANTRPT